MTDRRIVLQDLNRGLRELHRNLLQVAQAEYEAQWGPVSPGELLQLAIRHPDFAWLRPLSERMAGIDTLLDKDSLSRQDASATFDEVRALLSPEADAASDFSSRYREALQKDPALVMAHAEVRQVLGAHAAA